MVLTAVEVVAQKDKTFSRPLIIRCDDKQEYIAKFFDGNDKSILNEFVIGKLAKKMDLPIAEPFEIKIDDVGLINKINETRDHPINSGLHIGTLDLKLSFELSKSHHVNLDSKLIENLNVVPDIIAFDIFVCNTDRKGANSLVEVTDNGKQPFRYVMIDHGHCLGGPNWTLDGEKKLVWNQPVIPWKVDSVVGEQSFSPFIEKLKNLDSSDFKEIIKSASNEWKKPGDDEQLLNMLANRDVDQVIEQLKKYNKGQFPNWERT